MRLTYSQVSMRSWASLSLLLVGAPAWACWCAHISVEEEFAGSKAVFLATVVSEDPIGGVTSPEEWLARLQVQKVWKSDGRPIDIIVTPVHAGSCGTQLIPGEQYIVFAYRSDDGTLRTMTCNRTIPVEFGPKCTVYRHQCEHHKRRVTELLDFLRQREMQH